MLSFLAAGAAQGQGRHGPGEREAAVAKLDFRPVFPIYTAAVDFTDSAIVLSARRHGESDAILSLLTRAHGRHLGLVKGGAARRQRALLEIGSRLQAQWRARVAEQLGHFRIEPARAAAAAFLEDPGRLAALGAACALIDAALPEREPHADIFTDLDALVDRLAAGDADWAPLYVRWEARLLAALGFGLDLSRCALSGVREGLAYVSPRSGRAASAAAGAPFRDKLLPLPAFLLDEGAAAAAADILAGLRLTGHFLFAHVLGEQRARSPVPARERLIERVTLLA